MFGKIRYKLVFNRARRLNKRGEGLIEIECTQMKRRIYFTTHTYAKPENFSCGMVTDTPNADGLNYTLCLMMQNVERIELEYIKKGFLPGDQLRKLERLQLKGREDKVRDAFLVGCYTGLRFSDVVTLRDEHIKDGWLTKKMVKTGFLVDVPVGELFGGKMLTMLEKYEESVSRLTKNFGANASVNKVLRGILDRIDAAKQITFHSSRHTFATLLGQSGVQLTTIQKLLDHQKLQTTQIYSEVDRKAITNDLKKGRKRKV